MLQLAAFQYNLGHLGNAIALWLGIRPADVFVFVFLPPLLLYDAARSDFFMLRKVGRAARYVSPTPSTPACSCLGTLPPPPFLP